MKEQKQKPEEPKAESKQPRAYLDQKKETEAWHKMQADLRKRGLYDN